ncbi:unnamed protein product [Ilex paraguariensis]|uniref:Uncharacterized protein n=1 Tax=Ilex paraguariensis TaxID=185542 RepID=A0ABC8S6D9_9AQUA
MEDLRNYKVDVMDGDSMNVLGYTILGMPPPSSGLLGLSLVLNILDSYGSSQSAKGSQGLHRLIEALKFIFAVRMNLGDPDFVNISKTMSDMFSPRFAKKLHQKIFDDTTFPPEYYMYRWSQLRDHGTSHLCVVDANRNAVSMTTTVNYDFGAGCSLLPLVLCSTMKWRPLSSMTPIIVLKDDQLVGVIGGSGGLYIIPAVVQVFLNHFIFGMEPLAAVQSPRVYHELIPNVVTYENWTVFDGEHIELSNKKKQFLEERGHQPEARAGGAICQLLVQNLQNLIDMGRKNGKVGKDEVFRGTLTAVSDPRKDGRPAALIL